MAPFGVQKRTRVRSMRPKPRLSPPYNMTITPVSVLVAILVGGIEALALVADKLELDGWFWDGVAALNDNFGSLGFLIIAIFAASWLVSIAIYRLRGYDAIDPATP